MLILVFSILFHTHTHTTTARAHDFFLSKIALSPFSHASLKKCWHTSQNSLWFVLKATKPSIGFQMSSNVNLCVSIIWIHSHTEMQQSLSAAKAPKHTKKRCMGLCGACRQHDLIVLDLFSFLISFWNTIKKNKQYSNIFFHRYSIVEMGTQNLWLLSYQMHSQRNTAK